MARVQHRHMERIHNVFQVPQPTHRHDPHGIVRANAEARVSVCEDCFVVFEVLENLPARQNGSFLGWAHVGEDEAISLLYRIPR